LITLSDFILVPLALFVIKDGPEVLGQYVYDAAVTPIIAQKPSAAEHRDAREWSVAEAMRTAAFYPLAFCFAFGVLAQSAFLFHQAPFLEATVGLIGAASIVSVTTLSGLVGRVGFILFGDRITPRAWCAIVFSCAAAFLILALAETPLWLTPGSALFGLTMGVVVTQQPLGVAYMFGRASFGLIYGRIYMSIRIGSALGLQLLNCVGAYGAKADLAIQQLHPPGVDPGHNPVNSSGVRVDAGTGTRGQFWLMEIQGVLALAGIVVNNAVILIDRIDVERKRRDTIAEAIIEAGVRRLGPIVMTTCTTDPGLAPIIIARDELFCDLALVIAGGLLIGITLTLIVIPCLYAIVFGFGANKRTDQ
jgi:hypothetical protein